MSETAPKTIEEIGERTFRVKERMWALNTIGNMKYIWCHDMLNGTGVHKDNVYPGVYPEIQMLTKRGEELAKQKAENKHEMNPGQTDLDIESINKQIADFRIKECPECKSKYEFRLDKLADTASGEAIALGAGPSLLDKDDNMLPKMVEVLKRANFPIITCDRTLIPLLKAGIIPKYVGAADGVDHVIKYFQHDLVKQAIKEHGLAAMFNVQLHPNVTKLWVEEYGGKVLWYNVALDEIHKGKSLSRYLFHMTNDNVISVPWGHISAYCFGLGYLMGYNPMIFCGMDVGFRVDEDPIYDTPYWNPYFKATVREHIFKQIGIKPEESNTPKMTEQKRQAFIEIANSLGYSEQTEYMSKDKEFYDKHPEFVQKTISEHFHYYTNPFGNKVYHDNIFKAYKDIMMSFFIANNNAKIIQSSQYTTYFPTKCDNCNQTGKVNELVNQDKECFKCHNRRVEQVKGKMIECWKCKGTGTMGSNVRCISLGDYINEKMLPSIEVKVK